MHIGLVLKWHIPKSLLEMKSINFVIEKYSKVKIQTTEEPAKV
jgi:hypothetical protein